MVRKDATANINLGSVGVSIETGQTLGRTARTRLHQVSLGLFILTGAFWGLSGGKAHADSLDRALRSVVSVLPEWPPGRKNNDEPEGSGVVIRDGTIILTAWHVVGKALSIRVRTSDGDIVSAKPIGHDQATDLAILKIGQKRPAITFAPSKPPLGTSVCAIGNAFGLGLSLTCGVISGTNRAGVGFNAVEDFIQTDAAVNPGASGGALVTRDGQLVGMLSAIFTKTSDANIGVNFAVSTQLINRVVEDIMATGRVTRVLSGLQLGRAVERLGTGKLAARVIRVRPGSPAAEAGIKPGDAIFEAGGRRIRKPADFRSVMNSRRPPFELSLRLMRGTRKLSPRLRIPATDWATKQ